MVGCLGGYSCGTNQVEFLKSGAVAESSLEIKRFHELSQPLFLSSFNLLSLSINPA